MTTLSDIPNKIADEVIQEVRASKRRIAQRFDDNIDSLLAALIAQEKQTPPDSSGSHLTPTKPN